MYLTQGNFHGKTGPMDPARVIPSQPAFGDKYYPNRWQEDRNLRSLHKRMNSTQLSLGADRSIALGNTEFDQGPHVSESDQLNVANQKYLAIVYDIVRKEHVWKLLKWVDNLSEQHKKGLRVIKTVIDIKGAKKFKKNGAIAAGNETAAVTIDQLDAISGGGAFDSKAAKETFRKMTQRTSYRTQFGEPPKAAEDYVILKQKKFTQCDISKYVQHDKAAYLERWLQINDQDEFTKRIYFTIREIHTICRNLEAPGTTAKSFFSGRKAERVPRFDKILMAAKHDPRSKSSQAGPPKQFGSSIKLHEHLFELVDGQTQMKRDFPSVIDTKDFKQKFLRGQPYNITHYVELKNPKQTSYQATMHGKHHDDKAAIVDHERISCGIGGVIPDPHAMTKNSLRMTRFSNDLTNMERRNFTYTGDSWNVAV